MKTIAQKKELLKNYHIKDKKLDEIKELYERRRNQIISPGVQMITDMPTGSSCNKDKIMDRLMNIEQLERRMAEQQTEVLSEIYRIDDAIDALGCEICQTVLRLRYMKRMEWVAIARLTHSSLRNVQRVHGRALQMIEL